MKHAVLFVLLLATSPFAVASAGSAKLVEMENDDRLTTRSWAQWWLVSTSRPSRIQALEGADRSFERGDLKIARERYLLTAAHGDKFAQYRLGLIDLENDDPASAWAWFTLANESGREPAFAPYPAMVWKDLDKPQRQAARALLEERLQRYSDYGLAERMHRLFRQRLRTATGSRVGFAGNLLSNDGGSDSASFSSIAAAGFYDSLKEGVEVTGRLLDDYGTVTLGELEVLEAGESR